MAEFIEKPLAHLVEITETICKKATLKGYVEDLLNKVDQLLANDDLKQQIPRLENYQQIDDVQNGNLVQFRCMIQDSSLRKEAIAVPVDKDTVHLLFSEQQPLTPEICQKIQDAQAMGNFIEKQPYYCVEVPFETASLSKTSPPFALETDIALKKAKTPYVPETAHSVVAKVYEQTLEKWAPELKLNAIVNLIGILEYDANPEAPEQAPASAEAVLFEHERLPGFSAVPRLHVLSIERANTFFPRFSSSEVSLYGSSARQTGIDSLSAILGNDVIAAEYLWSALFSNLYPASLGERPGVGQFTLNLYNMSCAARSALLSWLSKVLYRVKHLPLALADLNSVRFDSFVSIDDSPTPGVTGIIAGELQLADGTVLVVDETAMSSGTVNKQGLSNLQALQKLLSQQKLTCDFGYQQVEIPSNMNALVLSDGKSMFETSFSVCVDSDSPSPKYSDTDLDQLRTTLANFLVKPMNYSIPEDLAEQIQNEYITIRQEQHAKKEPVMNQTDLFNLLNLARCITLSHGEHVLNPGYWQHAKSLEAARKLREKEHLNAIKKAKTQDLPQR